MDTKVKKTLLITLLWILWQQSADVYIEDLPFVKVVPYLSDYFYKTKTAKTIGDNCLLYQSEIYGGFPKNVFEQNRVTNFTRLQIKNKKNKKCYCSIDNGATTSEIFYLANLYSHTHRNEYKNSVLNGISFLFNLQYKNGGFPQCMNPEFEYQSQITYNDNAQINVLKLLREIAKKNPPFDFIDDEIANRAQESFDKGVQIILKTQITQDGKKTGWCAQHDCITLKPCQGRKYEHPSISGGRETVGILLFLMSIENPSNEIKNAVISGINWLEKSKISNLRKEYFTDNNGKKDYRMVECNNCPPIWARCYDIKTSKPIFSSKRDSHIEYNIHNITQTRRNAYEWYSSEGLNAIREYKKWKARENIK